MEITSWNGVSRQMTVSNHSRLIIKYYKSLHGKHKAMFEIAHTGYTVLTLPGSSSLPTFCYFITRLGVITGAAYLSS